MLMSYSYHGPWNFSNYHSMLFISINFFVLLYSLPNTNNVLFHCLIAHDSRIYVFNDKWLWRLNYWGLDQGFPKRANKVFKDLPYHIGAAVYSWRTRYTYFFKGNLTWPTFLKKKLFVQLRGDERTNP